MTDLSRLIVRNLDLVYFFYGLAFVLMGVAILCQPRPKIRFAFAGALGTVAWFGIVHGFSEFLDMWALLRPSWAAAGAPARVLCLLLSYLCLVEAGRRLAAAALPSGPLRRLLRVPSRRLLPLLAACVVIPAAAAPDFWGTASTLSRYLLGLPGGLLTGFALLGAYRADEKQLRSMGLRRYFLSAGWAFMIYGLLGGLVVPKGTFFPASILNYDSFLAAVGLPVQLLRAACAAVIGWGVVGMLQLHGMEMELLRQSMADLVVHDLKNPMTSILGTVGMLADGTVPEERRRELAAMARRACLHLMAIANDLLDSSRLELGELKSSLEPVEARELLRPCELEIELAAAAGIQVDVADMAGLPPPRVDAKLLQRVLRNLLQNAIKFTRSGGRISVRVSYDAAGDVWLFSVADTGIGIPKEQLGRLFSKYYRADTTSRRGTGLGLYFCRLAVEAHGGTIRAESDAGKGTTVSFTIPGRASGRPELPTDPRRTAAA